MTKLAFIGMGSMGGPMAANLVRAGHGVTGFDLSPAALEAARSAGVAVADSMTACVAGAAAVFTMLPAGPHVLSVLEETLPQAVPGCLFVDCSTIDMASARQAHALATGAGMVSLDAPVSGGVGGASAGTLTFMVGGTDEAFVRAQPLLEAMGSRIVRCGEGGAGQAAKICNNMILGVSMIAVSEAFVLAEKLGLSHQALFEVASNSSGQCWSLTAYCPVPGPVPASPANQGYKPGFAASLMLKDLQLAQDAAAATGADAQLGRNAAGLYARFAADGQAGLDFSAIIQSIRQRSTASGDQES